MELPDRPLFLRTVAPSDSLLEAARVMSCYDIGCLFVREDGDYPIIGVFTDRDIVKSIAEGNDPKLTTVERLSHHRVEMAPASASRLEWATKMRRHGIRRLALRDDDGEVCGVVSFDDLIFELGSELAELTKCIATGRRHAEPDPEPDL